MFQRLQLAFLGTRLLLKDPAGIRWKGGPVLFQMLLPVEPGLWVARDRNPIQLVLPAHEQYDMSLVIKMQLNFSWFLYTFFSRDDGITLSLSGPAVQTDIGMQWRAVLTIFTHIPGV